MPKGYSKNGINTGYFKKGVESLFKDKKHTVETINKIKGKKFPNRHHDKQFKKGQSAWNKGIKHTKETIDKIKESRMKYFLGGNSSPNKGKKLPQISGQNSPHWKGGITPITKQIRASFEYRQWRSDVFTKDDFTCKECGVRGGLLHADHIKLFSIIFQENNIKTFDNALKCSEFWNINNGQTLCAVCHRIKTNQDLTKGGYGNKI